VIDIWDYFDRFADAPNGIEKLRQLILDLAIRGKLVDFSSDNKTEQPIERLASQQQSIADKRLSKQIEKYKSVPADVVPVGDHNICDYVYLGSVADMHNGRSFKSSEWSESGTPIIRIQNLNNHQKPFNHCEVEVAEKHHINSGDILISWSGTPGTSFGAFIWERGFAYLNQHINRVDLIGDVFHPEFFVLAINAKLDELIQKAQGGVGLKHVTKATLNELVLPLPDIEIQQHVLDEYNRLMAICDELEEKQTRRQSLHVNLNESALDKLVKSESPAEFADSWGFISDNFELLYRHPDNIPKLRQGILDLAVRGKLVEQDPEDEPASQLLERVFNFKRSLEASGAIKIQPALDPIGNDEILFDIPANWAWVRANNVSYPISSGTTPPKQVFQDTPDGGVPYLKVYNIRNQKIDFAYKPQYINAEHHAKKMKRSVLIPGMVVLNIVGPPLGKTAIIQDDFPEWNCNQAIAFFRFIGDIHNRYVHTYLRSGNFLRNITLVGTAGQDNISVTKCKNIVIPLPPLEEQKRIVARVDELMAILDELEAKLKTSQENAAEFAESMAGTLV
jgi:type I restriction enzyme, S subunit